MQKSTRKNKVYPMMDLYNRESVLYLISLSPNFNQTKEMLNGALDKRSENDKSIFHSDQGFQY